MPKISLHVPDDERYLVDDLRERARREDRTLSQQLRRYLRDGLEADDDRDRSNRRRFRRTP